MLYDGTKKNMYDHIFNLKGVFIILISNVLSFSSLTRRVQYKLRIPQ